MRLVFWCRLLVCVLCCIVGHGKITAEDHVLLVAPVLAPPKSSRARVTETAKDFPLLMLLATNNTEPKVVEKKVGNEMQPIYVQKLEDLMPANIRKRRLLISKLMKHGGIY